MIPHNSGHTLIDFNREYSFILSIDHDGMQLYGVDSPILSLLPTSLSLLNKEFIFSINSKSVNPVTGGFLGCALTVKLIVVSPDNYTLWPTGLKPSPEYYANYPGELFIPLNNYVFGPNITWGVHEQTVIGELLSYLDIATNASKIYWDMPPRDLGLITLHISSKFKE
jgi:hypothetical protein